ncbi:MAG: hypothetical protein JOY61_03510 [Chloroflexi bacterium]|nr:hypothetical protein [Chloroflexota bacterium]
MPSWRPARASDPDEDEEWRFAPLAGLEPGLAATLLDRYARRWLDLARLPAERLHEVADTVELVVADEWSDDDEDPLPSGRILRLRSWYTGCTYWLREWEGDFDEASSWIDSVAEMQAGNVEYDRRYGPTPWDGAGSAVTDSSGVGRDRPRASRRSSMTKIPARAG